MARIQQLVLVQTMMHEMPRGRRREGGEEILYSSAPTPLDADTDRFIREAMLIPSLEQAREIVDVGLEASDVPRLAREVLADPDLLPSHSKVIAKHMHESQTGAASEGVFIASHATVAGQDRFVILKAEHQEGMRLRHTGEGENVVFQAEHLTELIMGQNSRVYKIAMLWLDPTANRLRGLMVDKQNGAGYADYFLDDFLGCSLAHQAEKQVKDFVDALTKFVNSPSLSPEKRTRYATAAVALIESPQDRLRPDDFIRQFIDPEDRDTLHQQLSPELHGAEFRKDLRLVQAQVGGLRFQMSTGVTLNASADALNNGDVRVEPESPEGPRVVVRGTPDKLGLSKAPRQ